VVGGKSGEKIIGGITGIVTNALLLGTISTPVAKAIGDMSVAPAAYTAGLATGWTNETRIL